MTVETTPTQANRELDRLRESMRRFYRLRSLNQLALVGADPQIKRKPREVRAVLLECRDTAKEREVADGLRDLLYGICGREPTPSEVQYKLLDDEGLGLLPAIIGLAAVVGGAAALTAGFNYLSQREETARARLRGGAISGAISELRGDAGRTAPLVVALAVLGVGGYLGWRYLLKPKMSVTSGEAEPELEPDEGEPEEGEPEEEGEE